MAPSRNAWIEAPGAVEAAASVMVVLVAALPAAGCDDEPGTGAVDGGAVEMDASAAPARPDPPALTPCPAGWREDSDADATWCEPWPGGRAEGCGADEAQLPGQEGCSPVGTACGTDPFANDLPADAPIVYVLADAAAGGDGTRGLPFARPREAVRAGVDGGVVALGRGRYDQIVELDRAVTLWGACTAETVLVSTVSGSSPGVVSSTALGTAIRNLRIGESPRAGITVVGAGAALQIDDVVVEGTAGVGVVAGRGASVRARGLAVRDIQAQGMNGHGIRIEAGSQGDLARVAVERASFGGIVVTGEGSALRLDEGAISDTAAIGGIGGIGLVVTPRADAVISRVALQGNRGATVYTWGIFDATDVVVRDSLPLEDHTFGSGVRVEAPDPAGGAAEASLARVLVEGSRWMGVIGTGAPATVRLTDVIVRDVQGRDSDGAFGRGLNLQLGAGGEAERVLIERSLEVAVFVGEEGSSLTARHLTVRDTLPLATGEVGGRGANVEGRATLYLSTATIERSIEGAIIANGPEVSVDAEDLSIEEVHAPGCAETTCPDYQYAVGLGSYAGASLTARLSSVTDADICGVQLATGAGVDLSHGEVRGALIGACMQVDGFDLTRLTDEVAFLGNGSNLQVTDLPIPGAAGGRAAPDSP